MKLKNLLLMIVVFTVLFVGCARQRTVTPPRVTPQVTPQGTTLDTPRVTPGLPDADIGPGTDSTVRRETGTGTGTGAGTAIREGTGTDTTVRQGTGTDTVVRERTGIDTDITRNGAGPGAAVGEDTGKGMGTGTGTEARTQASTGGSIENGTFNGDLYISSNNFRLINSTVRGNVYFTNVKARSTFKMDANSKITGRQELMK